MLRFLETLHPREATFTISPFETTGQQRTHPPPHATVGVKGRILTLLLCPTTRGKVCDPSPDLHIWSCNPRQGMRPLLHDLMKERTLVTPLMVFALPLFLGPLDKNVVILITCFTIPKVLLP